MKKVCKTVAAALLAVTLVGGTLPYGGGQFNTITPVVASAATTNDLLNDIRNYPQNYFTIDYNKSTKEYIITGFKKPEKYKDVQLTTLTIPASINGKKITRIKGKGDRFHTPAISDPDVTKIIISNGISVLDNDAIGLCDKLKTIEVPASFSFKSQCIRECKSLTKISPASEPNISDGFMRGCPKFKNAWSYKAALTMINYGYDITKYNGTPVVIDGGSSQEPIMWGDLYSAMISSLDDLEDSELLDTYLRIYSRYLLKNEIGVTDSMSFNEKVRLIYDYVITNVSYDNDAWSWSYDDNKNIDGEIIDNSDPMPWSKCAIFFSNKAVCSGYAKGLNYLFREAGITSFLITENDQVTYADGLLHDSGHAFNVIRDNGMYFIVDATMKYYGYMMNLDELRTRHKAEDIDNWIVYDINKKELSKEMNNAIRDNLSYALGDVNHNLVVDQTDIAALADYIKGSNSKKNEIIRNASLTNSQFLWIADANCDGKVDQADLTEIEIIKNRFTMSNEDFIKFLESINRL